MKDQDFFAAHPVFTRAQYASSEIGERTSPLTVDSQLQYYVERGQLVRVRRGLYAVVPPGASPENAPFDMYLIASRLAPDAVLAYHTALEFHGHAHSVHYRLLIQTARRMRPFSFRGHRFQAVSFPPSLVRKSAQLLEVTQKRYQIRVTTLERTLVDLLDRPQYGGGWEEIWRSLLSAGLFHYDRVVDYALSLGKPTTIALVGYFLDQNREQLMVDPAHLQRLKDKRPSSPCYLERNKRQPVHFVREWNLVVPEQLALQAWEEPHLT